MSNELERAATAASEALGVDVQVGSWPDGNRGKPSRSVALFARGITGIERAPFEQKIDIPTPAEALAYLEGLETGARIQKERYAALLEAVVMAVDCWQNGHDIIAGSHVAHAQAEALSQLED